MAINGQVQMAASGQIHLSADTCVALTALGDVESDNRHSSCRPVKSTKVLTGAAEVSSAPG